MVHEQALADQSTELSTLMQGKMSESLAGEAIWKDVDEETFIRFTHFAYTGDYSIPTMIVEASAQDIVNEVEKVEDLPPEPEPELEPAEENGFGFGSYTTPKKRKKRERASALRSIAFNSLTYPLLRPRSNFADTCDPTISEGSSENIGEILLIHASLYVLAEKWGVNSLKMLTLFKLHRSLSMFQLDGSKVSDILKLARYAYSDENTPDLNTAIDRLRNLVCQYVAAYAEVISEHPTFIKMIEEGGAFARDLWKCVVPRYLTE